MRARRLLGAEAQPRADARRAREGERLRREEGRAAARARRGSRQPRDARRRRRVALRRPDRGRSSDQPADGPRPDALIASRRGARPSLNPRMRHVAPAPLRPRRRRPATLEEVGSVLGSRASGSASSSRGRCASSAQSPPTSSSTSPSNHPRRTSAGQTAPQARCSFSYTLRTLA